jgi:hypothetical protein
MVGVVLAQEDGPVDAVIWAEFEQGEGPLASMTSGPDVKSGSQMF